MTKTVSSECSSLSDIDYDPIASTFARLRAVISQETSLRKELDNLFIKRAEDAHIAVQNAQNYLKLVKTQEAHMREILKTESAAANEMHDGPSNTRPEDTVGREQMAEWERLQEATMLEQRQQEERLADLERQWLAKEEEDRLIAQEAAMIAAVEARRQPEAKQRQTEEERSAKEEKHRIQEAAVVAAIEARRAAEARERQREEAEIAAQEEAERLKHEQKVTAELERIESERQAEEDRARLEDFEQLEQELVAAEMYRLAQEEDAEVAQLEQLMEEAAEAERQLQRLEAEESEMAELDRLEEARLMAEAAENEFLGRAGYEDEIERRRFDDLLAEEEELAEEEARIALAAEEARQEEAAMIIAIEEARRRDTEMREYDLYLRLKAETAVAEESLAMVDRQLAELEAQRNEVLWQVESARLEEVNYRHRSR